MVFVLKIGHILQLKIFLYIYVYSQIIENTYMLYAWSSGNAYVILILRSVDRFHQVVNIFFFHLNDEKNRKFKLHVTTHLFCFFLNSNVNSEYEHIQYE